MIQIRNLSKTFKTGNGNITALDNINLTINDGEIFGIIGLSGAGKSTLVRCINLLERPSLGNVILDGKDLTTLRSKELLLIRRQIGMIFQSFNLFEQRNILQNVCYPLRIAGVSKKEAVKKAHDLLEMVGLGDREKAYPSMLSGGQKQRVAIARALANSPHVLLLDEPLGALDLKLRKDMQTELKAIQKRLGITFIYVTHDQEEALSMSDTIVVMDKGKIQQIGTPEDIYNEPVNAFVADFIGESNIVDAIMIKDYLVSFGGVTFECLDSGFGENAFVEAVVRPEDIKIVKKGSKASLPGKITSVTFKGVHFEILVDVSGFIWMIQTIEHHEVGEEIGMYIEPDAIHIMNRSEYSGEFGDYSYFSDEMDHISDASYNWEEENEDEE